MRQPTPPEDFRLMFEDENGELIREEQLIEKFRREHAQRTFFAQVCAPSPFHWHFQQAYEALIAGFYLPGISGLLNGIEASLRTTISVIEGRGLDGDLGTVMSNSLLRRAEKYGMDINLLALPDEADFREKLTQKDGVQLVKLRNNICHGNFQSFVRDVEGIRYFTPECLRETSAHLIQVSFNWTKSLRNFYHQQGWRTTGSDGITIPDNPLRHWLKN